MARGNSRAQSELPSGVEATREDIRTLDREQADVKRAEAYANDFEKKSEYKSFGKVNIGDGQTGNGIIKDGKLHLREEDIDEIVQANFGESSVVQDLINDGGGQQPFALFAGENNQVDARTSPEAKAFSGSTSLIYNNEMGASPVYLPSGDDYDVDDFDPGESRTWEDPGSDASGSISIGDTDVNERFLQVAYEKASGLTVDRESVRKLAVAIMVECDKSARSVEEDKASDGDFWENYKDRIKEERSYRSRDYD
jgi:hypothetical protein